MPDHVLVGILVLPGRVARCACGWQSAPSLSVGQAEERWQIHVGQRRANDLTNQAAFVASKCQRRALELADLREAARTRRMELRTQRVRLRAQAAERASRRAAALARLVGPMLDRSRDMAGLSPNRLWTQYVALGGELSLEQVAELLSGRGPLSRRDHDILVLVINERFAELGAGQPLDFWDELDLEEATLGM